MAARKSTPQTTAVALGALTKYLSERGAVDRSTQIPVSDAAEHFKITPAEMITLLDTQLDPQSEIIDGDNGFLCLAENAEGVDTPPAAPVVSESSEEPTETEEKNVNTEKTPKIVGWVNDGGPTHFLEFEEGKRPNTGHTLLPEPDSIPEPPEGVNANVWELAHAAATLAGRMHWGNVAAEQMKAHALATLAQEEEQEEESDWTPPINPLTGEPYPF